jgi:hypothetical protein
VRESRVLPVGEDRGHPSALRGEPIVPEGVDAGIDAMKATSGDSASNRFGAQSQLAKLPQRHDPVLSARQLRELPLAMLGRFR